jgi:hypothetical protein
LIDRYVIDFVKTFGAAMLTGVDPKMQRVDKDDPKSAVEQARDKEGVLKWTVTVTVQTKSFDNTKTTYVNLPITVTSPARPCGAILPGSGVVVEGLEMGIMPQARDKGGFSVFYSAEVVRPMQPARPASGQ